MTFGLSALNGKRNQRLLNGKKWQKKKSCHRMPLSERSERMPLNAIKCHLVCNGKTQKSGTYFRTFRFKLVFGNYSYHTAGSRTKVAITIVSPHIVRAISTSTASSYDSGVLITRKPTTFIPRKPAKAELKVYSSTLK